MDKLYRKELILIVLFLKNEPKKNKNSKTESLDEIPKLNDKFDQLYSNVSIKKSKNIWTFWQYLNIPLLKTRHLPSIDVWCQKVYLKVGFSRQISMLGKCLVFSEGMFTYFRHSYRSWQWNCGREYGWINHWARL